MISICSRFVSVSFTIVSLASPWVSLVAGAASAQPDFSGAVRVIDGDTFDVGDVRVRLFGVDAPEQGQTCGGNGSGNWACGAWVTSEVRARYEGRRARCERLDTDRYGRAVARCAVDGDDMGRALVSDGLAFAYRTYSLDYDLDEKRAAVRGVGVHGTKVQRPAEFRAETRRAANAAALSEAPQGCVIKGNISSKGTPIYHMPGQKHYGPTRIDEGKGERWFCSEAQARSAGWRRARQ
ncbi:thermonuclease family protein [Alloyangia pacifica]|uniref:thermonuclease family protein n=1 Tax=Alloyangia pacifica TaxID=311180 RepID=UPI001CFC8DC8|nr:thermonuclease family protein [Alloyangia pacifica]